MPTISSSVFSPTCRAIVRLPTSIARAPALTRLLRARMRQSRRRMTAITKSAHRHSWMRLNRSTERPSGIISARDSRAFWTIRARCLRKALRCERSVTILRANTVRSCRGMRATPSSNASMLSSSMRTMPGREAWIRELRRVRVRYGIWARLHDGRN